jgi:hypothetical protein
MQIQVVKHRLRLARLEKQVSGNPGSKTQALLGQTVEELVF